MEAIFHEKQEGSLCAQHCLNALLQSNLFTAVDLAQIGQRLDEQERQHMLEGGIDSREYQSFLEQPSSNYDDSGFFSIQVLQEALRVWGLELVPFTSQNPVAQAAREDPTSQQAYICNFRQHWFCVRKLGNQWFNLNSLLTGPELISDTYLSLFLTQLQQEGYSLFVVVGELAETEADQLLRIMPAVQPIKPTLITPEGQGGGVEQAEEGDDQDQYLQRALAESRRLIEQDDTTLQQALRDSMAGYIEETIQRGGAGSSTSAVSGSVASGSSLVSTSSAQSTEPPHKPTPEELRQKRLAFLEGENKTASAVRSASDSSKASEPADDTSEEAMLQRALELSMEQPK